MLSTGRQLKAARALAGVSQKGLAKLADLCPNTIVAMEKAEFGTIRSDFKTVQAVQRALENRGVEFLDNTPGVRVRKAEIAP